MRIRSLGLLFAIALVLISAVSYAAPEDWKYYKYGYGKTIHYKWGDTETAAYDQHIARSAARWNTFNGSPVNAYHSSSSSNVFISGNQSLGYTWYGQYTAYTNIFGQVTRFEIRINVYRLMMENMWDDAWESVMGHEMGHAFALDDLDYGQQLMSHTRDRNQILAPQDGDQNGVKTIWK